MAACVVTKPVLNTLSMATNSSCIVSLPSLFSTNSTKTSSLHPCLSIPSKPIKLNLSCSQSYSSSSLLASLFSLKKKRGSHIGTSFSVITAQQEEDNTLVLEEKEKEEEDAEDEFEFGAVNSLEDSSEESEGGFEESEGGFEGFAVGVDEEDEYQEPPEDAKLFVGNLPYDVDSEKLAQLFEQAGVVEIAEVIYNRETDQSRGFGFVTMSTVEEAEKAVEMFNRYVGFETSFV